MRSKVLGLFAAGLLLGSATGCGGGGGGTGGVTGPGASGPLSARIDGVQWTSDQAGGGLSAGHPSPGLYIIPGRKASGTTTTFLDLSLYNVAGPGTYPLGVNFTTFGGTATVGNSTGGFGTPLSGAAGTAVVAVLTATRIAGTFAFIATPLTGSAVGTRTVTEGTFDYPISSAGSPGPMLDHMGSRFSALINRSPWNGATISALYSTTGTPILVLTAGTVTDQVSITATGVTAAGTYPISFSPNRLMFWNDLVTGKMWGGTGSLVGSAFVPNDSGQVVITSLTSTRVRGTFGARLAPGTGNIGATNKYITNGEFDCGLPQLTAH